MVDGDAEKIFEAVKRYKEAETMAKPTGKPRLAKVVARHYQMTRILNGAFRADTLPTVRYEVRKFTKKLGERVISDITRNDFQHWVRGLKLGPKGKKNVMGTVKLIFDHAIALELRKDNPAVGIELPKIDQPVPERFTASQCQELLVAGVRDKLPLHHPFVVGLLSGARPGEARRTGKRDVSLAEERINIPGAAVKTRQFRWVRITPLLEKWLKFIGVKNNGYLVPGRSKDKYESWRQQLAKAAGLENEWPFDGLRHTNASFDYALRGDFKAVADNLGNAPEISRKHYIAPATLEEANQFLALSPKHILSLITKRSRPPKSAVEE
jgi:integrase